MKRKRGKVTRNRLATREKILDAALASIAKNGAANLALTDVVRLSGVHRATVYQHFKTRNELIMATGERFSSKFYAEVHREPGRKVVIPPDGKNIIALSTRFADFVMENPDLCRIWLYDVLSSRDPTKDPIWTEYEGSFRQLFGTKFAQKNLDSQVIAVLILAGGILWPLWARAHTTGRAARTKLARRFSENLLRVAMYGIVKSEHFPDITAYLKNREATE